VRVLKGGRGVGGTRALVVKDVRLNVCGSLGQPRTRSEAGCMREEAPGRESDEARPPKEELDVCRRGRSGACRRWSRPATETRPGRHKW
jgi:hypothetical protein